MAKKHSKKIGTKVLLSVLVAVLTLILTAGIIATVIGKSMLGEINTVNYETEPTKSQDDIQNILDELNQGFTQGTEPDAYTTPLEPAPTIPMEGKTYNILIVGQDQRNKGEAKLSDTMILCTINVEKKTLIMTSFLRDMYVKLPNYNGMVCGHNRINVNYALGGMGMLDQCLLENFGIKVDHNIEVDFSAFKKIVDLMEGIDVELTKAECQYMNANNTGKVYYAGMNHLNGEEALVYARIRKIDNDFYRTNRQRTVLNKLLEKCKTRSVGQLYELMKTVLPMITTDMQEGDILGYAAEILPIVSELQVVTQHIPAEGTYTYDNKGTEENPMYVIIPDIEANRKILEDLFN